MFYHKGTSWLKGDLGMEEWMSKYTLYRKIHSFISDNPDFLYMDMDTFCKSKDWNLIPFGEADKELMLISKDGYTFYENGSFSIFYNQDKPKTRQRFTISHEIGHIILYHHFYVPTKILTNNKNKGIWEYQADTFAQNILFPIEWAENLKGQSIHNIAKFLGVSKEMVNVRYRNLSEDLYWLNEIKREEGSNGISK